MFCVSDRLYPPPPPPHHHHQLQHPATIIIPPSPAYDPQQQAAAVATMMMSMLPHGAQSLMITANVHRPVPLPLPLLTTTGGEYQRDSPPSTYDDRLTQRRAKLRAASRRRQQVRDGGTTDVSCDAATDPAAVTTSFRIADILGWRHRVACTSPGKTEASPVTTTTTTIVRPWDECSSSKSSVSDVVEERSAADDDEDDEEEEAAEIDVDDASCTSPPGTTSSDTSSDHDVCPLGALLRMTNQTNFDECANRLQECFNNGRYMLFTSWQ